MNEERIQQVLNIEKEAQQIHDTAVHDSEQLLIAADQEVSTIIENAQSEAQKEARRLVSEAEAKEESAHILADAQTKVNRTKDLSGGNFEHAVLYVLDRATGKE